VNIPAFAARSCGVAVAAALLVAIASGADSIIPRECHPWAAFGAGSWKLVKVTTETFDKDGKSIGSSVTETRTMLLSVNATSYELQIDVTADVAGKRFASEPRLTRQGFQGEAEGQQAIIHRLEPAKLQIAGRTIEAQSAEIEIAEKDSRRLTRLTYAAGMRPYVLGRHAVVYDATGKVQQETDVQTMKLQVPRTLLGVRRSTWETRTEQKHPAGTIVTNEVHCSDIPGGVVQHTSEEFDEAGKLIRRSKLELVNFGIATPRTPRFRRPHRRSHRKTARRSGSFIRLADEGELPRYVGHLAIAAGRRDAW
jgi:hypothetical protein